MIYGISEHYAEELADWNRILKFHKVESDGFERRLGPALERNVKPELEKERGELLDLFIVQHQRFDFIQKQVESQQTLLKDSKAAVSRPVESPIANQQNNLRSRMQSIERDFIRTKYNGYLFLSSFLKQ